MKKTLAIVLALAMVLCMIPAMSAETYKTISIADRAYTIGVYQIGTDGTTLTNLKTVEKANAITAEYTYDEKAAVSTGKWTEAKMMGLIEVKNFEDLTETEVLIDGKKLNVGDAAYASKCGYIVDGGAHAVQFPVELTKGGYTDTFVITLTGKNAAGDKVTEVAKVSVKLVDKSASAKGTKTAYITDIVSEDASKATVYIVGSKIYADYVGTAADLKCDITFADENGKPFSVITYADYTKKNVEVDAQKLKLKDSKTLYWVMPAAGKGDTKIVFGLETEASFYETKEYALVVRQNIKEEDPKGLYFEKSDVTIAVGEEYSPVVKGLANGKSYKATLVVYADNKATYENTDIIDYADEDHKVLIGTKPGVAYVGAYYTPAGQATLIAGAQKITVVAGKTIPPTAVTYYVTCRNLNVRKGPGTSYGKNGMIHRGDAVEVVEIANGWAKLANGTYVSANYIAK